MFLVSRLNLGYSAEEDRLRLACDNAEGERRELWLTRRFVLRLLDELATGAAPAAAPTATGLVGEQDRRAAESSATPVAPQTVTLRPAPAGKQGGLVTQLRLRFSPGGVSLGFVVEGDTVVLLDLDTPGVQRWRDLLAASCRAAVWPLAGDAAGERARVTVDAVRPRVLH